MDNPDDKFYCMITGSSRITDYGTFRKKMDHLLTNHKDSSKVEIVTGDGKAGADELARKYAKERGIVVTMFDTNREKYGRQAAARTSFAMLSYIAGHEKRGCVAFGTENETELARMMAEDFEDPIRVVNVAI